MMRAGIWQDASVHFAKSPNGGEAKHYGGC